MWSGRGLPTRCAGLDSRAGRALACSQRKRSRGVARRGLPGRMKRLEECHQRRGFRRTQVLSVGRHVAAALDHLANELILVESQRDPVERWPALSTFAHRANGSCGTASPGTRAHLGAREPCGHGDIGTESAGCSTRPSPGSTAHARPNASRCPGPTAASRIVRTAIGLRFQLFSPSPATKGSASSTTIPMAGPISNIGVSADGGKKDSSAYSHRKKKSGRGAV